MSDRSCEKGESSREAGGKVRTTKISGAGKKFSVRINKSSDSDNTLKKGPTGDSSQPQPLSGKDKFPTKEEKDRGEQKSRFRIKAHSRHLHSPRSVGSRGSKGSSSKGSLGQRSKRALTASPVLDKSKRVFKTRWYRQHLRVQSIVKKVARRLSSAEQSEDEVLHRRVERKPIGSAGPPTQHHSTRQSAASSSHVGPLRVQPLDPTKGGKGHSFKSSFSNHHHKSKKGHEVKFVTPPLAPPNSGHNSPFFSPAHSRKSSFSSEWSDAEELTLEQKFSVGALNKARASHASENLLRVAVTQRALSCQTSPDPTPIATPIATPPLSPRSTRTTKYIFGMSKEVVDSLRKEIEQWFKVKHCESMTYSEFTDVLSTWLLHAFEGKDDEGQALYEKLTSGLESFAVIGWNDIHHALMTGDDDLLKQSKEEQERINSRRRSSTFSDSDDVEGETSSYRTPVRATKRVTLERTLENEARIDASVLPVPTEFLSPGRHKSSTTFAETTPDFANRGGRRLPSILSSRVSDETLQHQVEEKARQASALPPHMSMRSLRRTASLDVVQTNTVSDPDQEEAIRSVALAILQRIDPEGLEAYGTRPEMHSRLKADPDSIYRFISNIFVKGELRTECLISCLVYIDRLCVTPEDGKGRYVQLDQRNWKALVTAALVIASKVWDDESLINEDFSILTQFSLEQINTWEQEILYFIKFDVQLSSSLYAAYYFNMRTLYKKYSGLFGRGARDASSASVFRKLQGHHRRYSTML